MTASGTMTMIAPEGLTMIDFRIRLEGVRPLLMNSPQGVDALHPTVIKKNRIARKSSKAKTDADLEELAHLEWLLALYFDEEVGPYLPSDNIFKALQEGAAKTRSGGTIREGVQFPENVNPLEYRGPRDREGLWADANFRFVTSVKQQRSRIMRTRPIFYTWAVEAQGLYDPEVLDLDDIKTAAARAGAYKGVGDWRPKNGRFNVAVEKM